MDVVFYSCSVILTLLGAILVDRVRQDLAEARRRR
jgi:hypothetical protein